MDSLSILQLYFSCAYPDIKRTSKKLNCLKSSSDRVYDNPKKAYQSQKYRERYLLEKNRVLRSNHVDNVDLQIAIELLQKSIPVKEIRRILYQSDYIYSLSDTTNKEQFSISAASYVVSIENSALSILPSQQVKFKLAQNNNLDLEM